jgi:abequosyltransferase
LAYELSICIPTLNRGDYIGETLESIASQLQDGIEVVIVDGGSTDKTEQVVNSYKQSFANIRYAKKDKTKRQPSNEGFARDCNYAVELAMGNYCWLMTDDDILIPGAISKILSKTRQGYPLIVASVEVRNKDLTKVLIPRRPNLLHDEIYKPSEWNRFAAEAGGCLSFVGAVIIERKLWLSRNRDKYFSSAFIHVGIIFDEVIKQDVMVIADPLISVRHGNAQWSNRAFEIWMFNWPELIWSSSSLSDQAKQMLAPRERWRNFKALLLLRALDEYSIKEYEMFLSHRLHSKRERLLARLIAKLPRKCLYIPAYVYLYARGSEASIVLFDLRSRSA